MHHNKKNIALTLSEISLITLLLIIFTLFFISIYSEGDSYNNKELDMDASELFYLTGNDNDIFIVNFSVGVLGSLLLG